MVRDYLRCERDAGRVLGPITGVVKAGVHVNRFEVIPKPYQPGKWRLIVDLSHPKGASINDGVDPNLCSVSYYIRRGKGDHRAWKGDGVGQGGHSKCLS